MREFELPVGPTMDGWTPRSSPTAVRVNGAHGWLAPFTESDARPLYNALHADGDPSRWAYMLHGPFDDEVHFTQFFTAMASNPAVALFATGRNGRAAEGMLTLGRASPENGSVEVGAIIYGPDFARTTAATEIIYLLARHVFGDLGYRRFEWKCDSLNAASRRAAERLGFQYEGTWRKHLIYKGRSRDTSWYAMTDDDWLTTVKPTYEAWLTPENFANGRQRSRLQDHIPPRSTA